MYSLQHAAMQLCNCAAFVDLECWFSFVLVFHSNSLYIFFFQWTRQSWMLIQWLWDNMVGDTTVSLQLQSIHLNTFNFLFICASLILIFVFQLSFYPLWFSHIHVPCSMLHVSRDNGMFVFFDFRFYECKLWTWTIEKW